MGGTDGNELGATTLALREPRGEPRVTRARERVGGTSPLELDVPEFIPRR